MFKKKKTIALTLGYAGTIPFICSAILVWYSNSNNVNFILNTILVYSYLIITFIGAVYWGVALISEEENPVKFFPISIFPFTAVWFISMINAKTSVKILVIILIINFFFIIEKYFLNKKSIPKWYFILRTKLNIIVTISLLIILLNLI